jgi:hypothetical protein
LADPERAVRDLLLDQLTPMLSVALELGLIQPGPHAVKDAPPLQRCL